MKLDVPVPDFSTTSRRGKGVRLPTKPTVKRADPVHLEVDSTGLKIFGEGEWLDKRHETKAKHKSLLSAECCAITCRAREGAYDGTPTDDLLRARFGETVEIIIPPPKNAALSSQSAHDPTFRDRRIAEIQARGRMAWQARSGYNQRSRIETQTGRWKTTIGPKLKARRFENQHTEVKTSVAILNQMTELGTPVFEQIA